MDEKNSCDAETKKYTLDHLAFCKKIEPYVAYYKRQTRSYNDTVHKILKKEINPILLQLLTKQKCGIITTLVSSFIWLAYKVSLVFCIVKDTKHYITVKAMDS